MSKSSGRLWCARVFGEYSDAARERDEISKHLNFRSAVIHRRTMRVDGESVIACILIVRVEP